MNCSEHLINKNILDISDLVLPKMRSEKKFGYTVGQITFVETVLTTVSFN